MESYKYTYEQLQAENDELRLRLEEANDTIEAIRSGQIDALVVKGDEGHQLYTLKTADQTYRFY
jgi:two-component system phosphate regulon sensor histidine kinase PhoR